MEALGKSDELLQRSRELVAQSVRMRAAADWKMAKSRRLIVVGAQAREAMEQAHGWNPGQPPRESAADVPTGWLENLDALAAP